MSYSVKRKLPLKGSSEAEELKLLYPTASHEQVAEWAKKYGYKNKHSFVNSMGLRLGIWRSKPSGGTLAKVISPPQLSELEEKVLKIAQHRAVSVSEISRQVDRSSETVIKIIDSLRDKNYVVELDVVSHLVSIPQEPDRQFAPTEIRYYRKFYRIGLVADTQMGSKYQQITLLHDAYADFGKRRVDFILHAGDVTEGVGVYRGQDIEIFLHDPYGDEHVKYVTTNYPQPPENGAKTYIIGGQHDRIFWSRHGKDIVQAICKERKDLVYRGFFSAEFRIKGLPIRLEHPGGGVAYARSYRPQKYIEDIAGYVMSVIRQPEQLKKALPALMVFGHWHLPLQLPCYMGVNAITLPCFQSQTPYLQQKGKMPVVGYAIAEIYLDDNNNLTSSKVEFVNQNAYIRERDY